MTTIDLFIPVFNEEKSLKTNISQVLSFLSTLPYVVNLTIIDNASTDSTPKISKELQAESSAVSYIRLERKGRGAALRKGWLESEADIVAYMDIDLSTELSYLSLLFDEILSNNKDVVTGSRLSKNSIVTGRSVQREILSQGYNRMLKFFMDSPVRDAQCGFKAIRTEVFRALEPEIKDNVWFFDTELLLLAHYRGYSVSELPVHWNDDPDSKVKVSSAVAEDLKGMWRVYWANHPNSLFTRLFRFGSIGLLTAFGYWGMYALVSLTLNPQISNLLTLATMTLINTALNRRFTFRRTGLKGAHLHYFAGVLAFFLSLGVSALGIWILFKVNPHIPHLQESLWVTLFSFTATIVKYMVFALGFHEKKPDITSSPNQSEIEPV